MVTAHPTPATPAVPSGAGREEREFDFAMRVVDADREGYYVTRWDRATPITVRAVNRAAAFEQVWAAMGDAPVGRYWTAQVDRIAEVTS